MRTKLTVFFLLFLTSTGRASISRGQNATGGLVIETIDKFSAPAQAGLERGDVLSSWQRTTHGVLTAGEFKTPFDGRTFEVEQLPRGGVTITFFHEGIQHSASVRPGFFGISLRPAFSREDLAAYSAGEAHESNDPEATLGSWRRLIDRLAATKDEATAAWLLARAGSAFVHAKQVNRARETFYEAIVLARRVDDASLEAMVWETQGRALCPDLPTSKDRQFIEDNADAAVAAHKEAWRLRQEAAPNGLAAAESLLDLGHAEALKSFAIVGLPNEGEALWRQSGSRIREAEGAVDALAPESFAHARVLSFLANFVENDQEGLSRYTRAEALAAFEPIARRAWGIFDRLGSAHPIFLELVNLLENSAIMGQTSGGFSDAEPVLRKEFSLAQQLGDHDFMSLAATNLAVVLDRRGAMDEAIRFLQGLPKELFDDPGIQNNLASSFSMRGDLGASEDVWFSRLNRAKSPTEKMSVLEALGRNDFHRGDLSSAETLIKRALDLREQAAKETYAKRVTYWAEQPQDLPPDKATLRSRETNPKWHRRFEADDLELLAQIAVAAGDTTHALESMKEAVSLDEFNPPAPLNINQTRRAGSLARMEGDFRASEVDLATVLDYVTRISPGSSAQADALENVGVVQYLQHHFASARLTLTSASAIRERIQSGTQSFAGTLHRLGLVEREDGHLDQARRYFLQALDVLDDQRTRLGMPSFSLSGFSASVSAYYADAAEALVSQRQFAEAFHVLERSRARTMLEMMAQRDLGSVESEPASLVVHRRELEGDYDRLQTIIETLNPSKQSTDLTDALARLREIRLKLDDVSAQIAKASPRLEQFRRQSPLTLQQARASLDVGTVLLSYLVGADRTYLFVVTPSTNSSAGAGLSVIKIQAGDQQLRDSVQTFRNLLDWETNPKTANRTALLAKAQALYDLLIKPAESQIRSGDRILFSLDGPLQTLPFAALARTNASGVEFLAEWKPIHTTLSMTVYAQMRTTAGVPPSSQKILAFGDPSYAAVDTSSDPETAFFTRRGAQLTALPASRREVADIQQLFAPDVTTYLGSEATEENAKAINRSAKYVHFAVHGVINEVLPLNSALVFTPPKQQGPGTDNGLLQAWEIVEHIHLAADLVTLSACDSGLGKEIAGEGLLGLTSAFLYAGARSVAASLWKVADAPTEELMKRFYTNLRAGETKDRALQLAQIAMIKMGREAGSPIDYSDPVYWAAFQLTGDWK